jgi:hypothetical protein
VSQKIEQSNVHKCPWCDVKKNLRGLACHAGKTHKQPASEVHRLTLHHGVIPLCACGCGQQVKWLQKKYGEYLRGHNGFSVSARAAKKVNRVKTKSKTELKEEKTKVSLSPLPVVVNVLASPVITSLKQKPSIAQLSGEAIICEFCRTPRASHVACTQCPACGPATLSARLTFENKMKELSSACSLYKNEAWQLGENGPIVFLDAPWKHSLPGPLKSRAQVENETAMLIQSGMDVLRFYEDEWVNKPSVILSIIKHTLGISDQREYARACEVIQLSQEERKEFFSRCHLEGDVRGLIAFGLRHKNSGKILAALSAREPFHKTVHVNKLEIARFACEINTAVAGAQSKLVMHLSRWAKEHGYKGILSYADGRLGDGKSYEKIGFVKIKRGSPRLWWTDYTHRFNRFKIRADSAAGITQNQRAVNAGVVEMWGCGNTTFELQLT